MKRNVRGFTLLEVVVSMVVISILATAVLTGSQGLLHRQRFTDVANRLNILIQRARNLSQTQTADDKTFGVYFPIAPGQGDSLILFQDGERKNGIYDPQDTMIERIFIDPQMFILNAQKNPNIGCQVNASIVFVKKSTQKMLYCDNNPEVHTLKIELQSRKMESLSRRYLINKVSEVVQ